MTVMPLNGNGKLVKDIMLVLYRAASILLFGLACYLIESRLTSVNDQISRISGQLENTQRIIQSVLVDAGQQKTRIDVLWEERKK